MRRVLQRTLLHGFNRRCLRCKSAAAAAAPDSEPGVLAAYQRLVQAGKLHRDPTQLAAVQALQLLQDALVIRASFTPTAAAAAASEGPSSSISDATAGSKSTAAAAASSDSAAAAAASAAGRQEAQPPLHVQGAYLFGPVGSGKTFLMDLFLNTLPVIGTADQHGDAAATSSSSSTTSKVALTAHRLHYHEFMLLAHERLHQLQQALPRVVARSRSTGLPFYRYAPPPDDPVLLVARDAAAGLDLLCLDELHVTDVADAMLLARLVGEVLACGCAVVFTSNRAPAELYKGGLSRKFFEPFIRLVDERLLQLKVAGSRDYRLLHAAKQQPVAGMWLLGKGGDKELQRQWHLAAQQAEASSPDAVVEGPSQLPLPFGRSMYLPRALLQHEQPLATFFSFEELCGDKGCRASLAHAGALSANDYLALVKSCPNIFLAGLRQLQPADQDSARRLVTLIDLAYEAHALAPGRLRLFVSAACEPSEVFLPLLSAAARQGVNPNLGRASGSRLNVKQLLREHSGQAAHDRQGGHDIQPRPVAAASREQRESPEGEMLPAALLPEEVLSYHRASSRLAELCTVLVAEEAEEARSTGSEAL